MEFNGLTSASHMSLPEAAYGYEEGQLGSEISGAVSDVTSPGASRLQASQLQERSATMQRLHLAGDPLLECVLARLSPVTSMALHAFAMVPDAAGPGSDQWPWGTAPAAGPVGRLGRPSASDPWGVVCCYLSCSCPKVSDDSMLHFFERCPLHIYLRAL